MIRTVADEIGFFGIIGGSFFLCFVALKTYSAPAPSVDSKAPVTCPAPDRAGLEQQGGFTVPPLPGRSPDTTGRSAPACHP
jgi:hypothetical protein